MAGIGLVSIGVPSLIMIVSLIIFGPQKLPEMGSAFGKTLKEFKKSTSELMDGEPDNLDNDNKQDKT